MIQYDNIAKDYQGVIRDFPARTLVIVPTVRELVGDVSGKSALDLACGEGFWSRCLINWGASSVVGFDNSEKMIALASEQERQNPLGISYELADLGVRQTLPKVDLVFAGYLLHYATNEETLRSMCVNIANALPSGGKFVALINNPEIPLHSLSKYRRSVEALEELRDGSLLRVRMYKNNGEETSFIIHYWSQETYQRILTEVGFESVNWKNLKLGNLDGTGYDSTYWQEYLAENEPRPVECIKA